MANWTDAILTEKGKALAAKVMAGQLDLQLTEIWFGDGTPGTDLGSKKIKAELIKKSQEGTDCVIRFRVRNTTVQTPIIMRELGFYAVDADGSTILFSYMTDDEPATLPKYSGGKEYRQTMISAFGFSNAEQVTLSATILDGQTEEDVEAAIAAHDANVDAHNVLMTKHNTDSSAHEDIRQMFNNYLSREDTENQLSTHNTDEQAHGNRFNAIIQQVNNMITPIDDLDKQSLAPTLALVKTLLSNFDIKNSTDVITALDTETLASLGVSYSLANQNAWYICLGKLFGGLIIQGGNNLVRANRDSLITLPISYTKFFVPVSNPEHDTTHNFTINMVSMYSGVEGLNKVKLSTDVWGDSDVNKEIYCWWLTVGI